jgi:NAD(P)H-dependent FMN reductase
MTKIGVILGSMREQRHGAYILSWLLEQAPQDSETEIVVLDLQNYNMPFFGQKDTDGIAAK